MEIKELLEILRQGEDSRYQFKKNVTNADGLAAEMAAFSNGEGGKILIGIDDNGAIAGLTLDDVRRLNQLISNAASQCIEPPINPLTENIKTDSGIVIIVSIVSGINKPYQDKNGIFWVKCGADKRKASREEIQRLFQSSNLIHADEIPVQGSVISDLDIDYFQDFFQTKINTLAQEPNLPLQNILKNMNLLKDDCLNICAVLLFAKAPQYQLPAFIVRAGAFDAIDLSADKYDDSREIVGKLASVFEQTVNFIISNIHHIQAEQGINSIGIPEIPQESIEELVANALIHRDYFISAPVRVFIFRDRVEIISPGRLPNNLTVENIKTGNTNTRNPILESFAKYLIPYRGFGSGIIRALSKYPHIDFVNDKEKNLFTAILKRRSQ